MRRPNRAANGYAVWNKDPKDLAFHERYGCYVEGVDYYVTKPERKGPLFTPGNNLRDDFIYLTRCIFPSTTVRDSIYFRKIRSHLLDERYRDAAELIDNSEHKKSLRILHNILSCEYGFAPISDTGFTYTADQVESRKNTLETIRSKYK